METISNEELKKLIREIVEAVRLDRETDDLASLKTVSQKSKTLSFNVGEMEYKVSIGETIEETGKLILSTFAFINVTAGKRVVKRDDETLADFAARFQQTKTGLTGTGGQLRVFNKIYNIFIKYTERFRPVFVGYEAIEDNRQKLYNTLMARATKESGLRFSERLNKHPVTDENIKPTEFFFQVEYPQ